ncbi:MAG: lecithin retinol acyltransferase family protein [Chitinophagales bacterium]|nr:lecithin retinol acyltransferase family protein [Chitinophagales bacterium]
MSRHPVIARYGLEPGDRIIEPKSGWNIIQHHSIYLGQDQYGHDLITENNAGYGVRIVTANEYFKTVSRINKIEKFKGSNLDRKAMVQNVLRSVGRPYDLISYNCEHFANEILTGHSTSTQVQGVLGIGILLLVGLFVANAD